LSSSRVWCAVLLAVIAGCGSSSQNVAPAAAGGAAPSSTATQPAPTVATPAASAAPAEDPSPAGGAGRAAGVQFRVPAGWTVRNDGAFAVARSKAGDAGFVLAGSDETSKLPDALHLAESEFDARFPVGLGDQKVQIGALPYTFLLSQAEEQRKGRVLRTTTLMGRGPKTMSLVVLAYVNVSAGPDGDAEGVRHGQVFETIFASFAPEP
jgi:hypothetical protein